MKQVITFTMLLLTAGAYSQQSHPSKFLRVYIDNSKRIVSGFYVLADSSSLVLRTPGDDTVKIGVEKIGMIKTGRTTGYHILIGSVLAATVGTLVGLVSYNDPGPYAILDFGAGFSAAMGFLTGGLIGTLAGGLSGALKHKPILIVNGRRDYWNRAIMKLNDTPSGQKEIGFNAMK